MGRDNSDLAATLATRRRRWCNAVATLPFLRINPRVPWATTPREAGLAANVLPRGLEPQGGAGRPEGTFARQSAAGKHLGIFKLDGAAFVEGMRSSSSP